jgi:hypothetical protein
MLDSENWELDAICDTFMPQSFELEAPIPFNYESATIIPDSEPTELVVKKKRTRVKWT